MVGATGETSEDLKDLLDHIAVARTRLVQSEIGQRKGRLVSDKQQLASVTSQTRQQLSRVAVAAQARILFDRLEVFCGGGAEEARKRRDNARWLEREWEKERRGQLIFEQCGKRIHRTGCFLKQ